MRYEEAHWWNPIRSCLLIILFSVWYLENYQLLFLFRFILVYVMSVLTDYWKFKMNLKFEYEITNDKKLYEWMMWMI